MDNEKSPVKSLLAHDMIREMILSGKLLPGSRLIVTDLEVLLGVGRGPVRDALMRLDKSGLVQNIPHKGALVALPPTSVEMEQIYQLRVHVETALAIEAMHRAQPKDIDNLEDLTSTMLAKLEDNLYFFHDDRQFHTSLYALANMRHLHSIVENLFDVVEIFLNTRFYGDEDKHLFIEQHYAIIQAMRNKDELTLRQILEQNILVGLELVRNEMARYRRAY